MKKKIVAVATAVGVMASLVPVSAFACDVVDPGFSKLPVDLEKIEESINVNDNMGVVPELDIVDPGFGKLPLPEVDVDKIKESINVNDNMGVVPELDIVDPGFGRLPIVLPEYDIVDPAFGRLPIVLPEYDIVDPAFGRFPLPKLNLQNWKDSVNVNDNMGIVK